MEVKLLKHYLSNETGCEIQHDGWPCGTCFHTIDIKLKEDISEYWQPVLSVRGDYFGFKFDDDMNKFPDLINELYSTLKGEKWDELKS